MTRGASLEGHINPTPGGPLRVNDGEGFAAGAIMTTTGRACGAANRGERHRVPGIAGNADREVICEYDGNGYVWRNRHDGRVNVRDYGATGDGSTDDTAAFVAAHAALLTTGGTIYVPPGTYSISSVTLSQSTHLIGAGRTATRIRARDATSNVLIMDAAFCSAEHLTFDAAVTRTAGAYVHMTTDGYGGHLTDFDMYGYYIGARLTAAAYARVSHGVLLNGASSAGSCGILIDAGNDTYVTQVTMDADAGAQPKAGIQITSTGCVNLTDCDVIHHTESLLVDPTGTDVVASVYAENCFFDTATRGLAIQPTGDASVVRCRFVGCWFSSHANQGILIDGSLSTGVISGITFEDPHVFLNGLDGVRLQSATLSDIRINGGQIAENTGSGISIGPDVERWALISVRSGDAAGLTGNAYGLYLDGPNDNYQIVGCDFTGNVTADTVGLVADAATTRMAANMPDTYDVAGGGGAGTGDVVGPAASVASEIALFDGITGKLLKRATTTGVLKGTAGVLSAATAGTDYYNPGGTDVAIADGGTGASTAAGAIANLGLDADIATLALPASTTISAFGATLVDDANAAAAIATLGLDADLATFALPASTTISAFGATLVDDANAAAAIATLGLDADIATLSLPASTTISAFGATLVDDANAAAAIATLGLDADIATLALPASTTISAFGATVVDDANAAAVIATLGLDADLATLALPASTTISAFGATLVDDANAATARTTLGLTTGAAGDIWVDLAGDTMTGPLTLSSTSPEQRFFESDAILDEKYWRISIDGGALNLQTVNDAFASATTAMSIDRAGQTPTAPTFSGLAGTGTRVATTSAAGLLAGDTSTGIVSLNAGVITGRTITGTANKIDVTNGNGTGGNPTITIPDTPTIVTPTIASFVNATHNHTNAAGGGVLSDAAYLAGQFVLDANSGAIGAGIADYFGSTSAFSTEASTRYIFEYWCLFTKQTANTITWTFTNTQTHNAIWGWAETTAIAGVTPVGASANMGFPATVTIVTAASVAFPVTGTLAITVPHMHRITVYAHTGATPGNARLRVTNTTGTVTPMRGSFYTVRKISGNVGSFVA